MVTLLWLLLSKNNCRLKFSTRLEENWQDHEQYLTYPFRKISLSLNAQKSPQKITQNRQTVVNEISREILFCLFCFSTLLVCLYLYKQLDVINNWIKLERKKKRPKGRAVQTGPGVPCEAPPNQISKNYESKGCKFLEKLWCCVGGSITR